MGRRKRASRRVGRAPPRGEVPSYGPGRLRSVALVNALAVVIGLLIGALLLFGPATDDSPDGYKAAIVDQLGLAEPNPSFVGAATRMLEQAGYEVDYYASEEVTIDVYRDLPKHGYDYIILRVHSGPRRRPDRTFTDQLFLFSSEPYSRGMYIAPQLAEYLGHGRYQEEGPEYLGIGPGFVRSSMRGDFDGTTIIMMGCNGLTTSTTAEALLARGAKAVVSWDGDVSAPHTDAATERLLEHLVSEGLTPQDAVARTAAEVGPDPAYGSELRILSDEG